MSVYYIKQPSSRPVLTVTSTSNPTKSSAQTYQLRVTTTAASTIIIMDTSSTGTGVTVTFAANVAGEYLTVNPGQWYLPGPSMTVTEMS